MMFFTNRLSRFAPMLTALVIVLGVGLLHGTWTQRWVKSAALEAAVARLDSLPDHAGDWHGQAIELDPQALRQAGADGYWLRRFTNAKTGAAVNLFILCGRSGKMAVHRPEHCYQGAGYEMLAAPALQRLDPVSASLWTTRFRKQDAAGPVELRIFWSWLADGQWQTPESPRLTFARPPVLYKLYAIHEMTGSRQRVEDDPSLDLLRTLLPAVTQTLTAG